MMADINPVRDFLGMDDEIIIYYYKELVRCRITKVMGNTLEVAIPCHEIHHTIFREDVIAVCF